jgi:hypothetical protein
MNNFKLSNKKIYNDSRSSIENLHDEKMESILNQYDSIDNKKEKLNFLKQKCEIIDNLDKKNQTIKNVKSLYSLKNDIKTLEDEIISLENNHDLVDYIDKAWDFLENFKDNDNNLQIEINKEKIKSEEFIDTNVDDSNILQYIKKTGKTNKGEEYKKYYSKCVLNINHPIKTNTNTNCKNCNSNNFEIDTKGGIIICTNCAMCEPYVEYNSSNMNYNEYSNMETISQPFSYQRKNHFKEWLNQLQGKEVTLIPESVINLVLQEIKKERITNMDEITSERIKKYLKKLNLNKYYEHIPNVISKITNKPPLTISSQFYDVLLNLFDKIQEPFKKYCPKERKNFLSYSYTLHKFCQLLNKNEYLIYFPLLKSREKLFEQEKIWKGICCDLGWKFTASI